MVRWKGGNLGIDVILQCYVRVNDAGRISPENVEVNRIRRIKMCRLSGVQREHQCDDCAQTVLIHIFVSFRVVAAPGEKHR